MIALLQHGLDFADNPANWAFSSQFNSLENIDDTDEI
jgi:hypothetical protein